MAGKFCRLCSLNPHTVYATMLCILPWALDMAPHAHSTLSADAGVGSFLLDGVDDDVLFITATDGMVKVAVTVEVEVEVEVEEGRCGSTNSGGGGGWTSWRIGR